MSSFPLRRLPLLAIREVIKSMNTKEIFYLSVLSKKSQNFVMLSIPKNSFSAEFTFKKDGLIFELMPKGYIKQAAVILPVDPSSTEKQSLFMRFSICGLYVQCGWTCTSEVEASIEKLFFNFSKTFKNSKINMKFEAGNREEFAMNILRFSWGNGFQLDHIGFCVKYASPESIQELLNGCNEQHTSLEIGSKVPEGFKYTPPPGGYQLKSLTVYDAHWINLDDFLQCREVFLWSRIPKLTVEYLNGLLKKIVNLESRLERFIFELESIEPTDFPEIVTGLSESAIIQHGTSQGLQFKRKDGLKLLVSHFDGYIYLD